MTLSVSLMRDRRRDLPHQLLARLRPLPVHVVERPGSSVWDCARAAWLTGIGDYIICFQDDFLPAKGFPVLARSFLAKYPDNPIAFWAWVPHEVSRGGALSMQIYANGGALCLPRRWVEPFLKWCERLDPLWGPDDSRFALWCSATGRRILTPVPHLVQHVSVVSLARPGQSIPRSDHFEDDPGRVRWSDVIVEHKANVKDFLISRYMHCKNKGKPGEVWWL